jgi:hypothetical protein
MRLSTFDCQIVDGICQSRFLVAEGLQERERKLLSIKGLLSQRRNRFFNLNGVQLFALLV